MRLVTLGSLQELAEQLYAAIGNPVTIGDRTFAVIAYSRQPAQVDRNRVESILLKHTPPETHREFERRGILEGLLRSRGPVRLSPIPEVGMGCRVAQPIRRGHELVGFIWVAELRRSVGDDELKMIRKAALDAAELMVQYEREQTQRYADVDAFLLELLGGRLSETAAEVRAEALGMLPHRARMMLRLETESPAPAATARGAPPTWLLPLRRRLSDLLAGQGLVGKSGTCLHILMVCDPDEPAEAIRQRIHDQWLALQKSAQPFGQHLQLRLGVGGRVEKWKHTARSLDEAHLGLHLGQVFCPGECLLYSEDFGVLRVLQHVEPRLIAEYADIRLSRLAAHDLKKGTDYCRTLEAYLDLGANASRVARQLNLHPNGVLYRLRRIEKLTGLCLGEMENNFLLHAEIKLRKLARQ